MREICVEKTFEYKDHECMIIFMSSGYRCGYVALNKEDPYYGLSYDDIDIRCHGGLTYSSNHPPRHAESDKWWVGFDTAHSDDARDYECARKHFKDDIVILDHLRLLESVDKIYPIGTIKTLEFVEKECCNIVDQIIAKGKGGIIIKYLIDSNPKPIALHNEPGSQVIRPCKLCGSMPSLAPFMPWRPGKNHKNRTGYDRKFIMFCSNHDCANYHKMVIGYMCKPIVQWNRWQSPYKRNHRCWELYNNPEFMNHISRKE